LCFFDRSLRCIHLCSCLFGGGDRGVVHLSTDRVFRQQRGIAVDVLLGVRQIGFCRSELRLGAGDLSPVFAGINGEQRLVLLHEGAVVEVLLQQHAGDTGAQIDFLRAANFADFVDVKLCLGGRDRDDLDLDRRHLLV
jgi:hypothetical protein